MASRESDIIHANILNNKEGKRRKKTNKKLKIKKKIRRRRREKAKDMNIPSCAVQLLPRKKEKNKINKILGSSLFLTYYADALRKYWRRKKEKKKLL